MHAWRARCRRAAIGRAGSLRDRHHGGDGVRQGHGRHRDRRDADLIDHGENGLLVPAGDVAALRDAMQRCSTTAPCSAVRGGEPRAGGAPQGRRGRQPYRAGLSGGAAPGDAPGRRAGASGIGRTAVPVVSASSAFVRIREALRDSATLATNSGALAIGAIATAALGFVYWWLAARMFPPHGSDRQRVRPAIRHQSDGPAGRGGARHPAGR